MAGHEHRRQAGRIATGGLAGGERDFERHRDRFRCASAFDSHPRDVDVSPDGGWFVVVTTGAYSSRGSLCDTASEMPPRSMWEARFETARAQGLAGLVDKLLLGEVKP